MQATMTASHEPFEAERADDEFAPAPSGPVPKRGQTLRDRFDRQIDSWDRHLAACSECLTVGLHLCAEAEFLADDLRTTREQRARHDRPRIDGVGFLARLRVQPAGGV